RHDVPTQALAPAELAQLEPALAPIFPRALWIQGSYSVDDPAAVTAAYAELFQRSGGTLRRLRATAIRRDGGRGWIVQGDAGSDTLTAPDLVVALGPWSKELLKTTGIDLPLA
ncbi:NAD(P)/FAD-dependent oxidoreductase, partial [Achromobacter xylosoxidans]